MAASFLMPILLIIVRPLDMTLQQSAVAAILVLVITWWSAGLVNKIISSLILLAAFLVVGQAPADTVFSFLLSDNFLLIIFCYLFSRGIDNACISEKTLSPLLFRYVDTPVKMLIAVIAFFLVTIYVIPQPLARLIIIANIIRGHLQKTDAGQDTQEVLLFGVFVFYVIVNMVSLNADIILNTSSVGFAGLTMTDGEWMKYMAFPSAVYCVVILLFFCMIFRKQVLSGRFSAVTSGRREPFSRKEKQVLAIIVATVILWMTSGWHGISPTYITLAGTVLLFAMGVLKKKDFSAIDVSTMVFLTAAFCIGGVMKYTGIADIIFSRVGNLFPAQFGVGYLLMIILITMGMHLILGSNTTTLSVVLPGLMTICGQMLPGPEIFFIAYISLVAHFLLPFHAVSMMIGVGNKYFPAKYVTKFGAPMMVVIILAIFGIFLPYWNLMGLV